ncbi:MAG TPA: response regulator transcription factor [Jatrophihabitans sp.]|nr:response regulator transcription factor [Jatrophihabitans sp.]
MAHVLVVDDEPLLLRTLVLALSHHGYQVSSAATGRAAITLAVQTKPDVVLLDLGLPDLDGLEVIQQLLERDPDATIMVLSARSGSSDKVVTLDIGAVDYITKPFDISELVARLRAVIRRRQARTPVLLELEAVRIDLAAGAVFDRRSGEPIHLTPTEWRIVRALTDRPGALVSSAELLIASRGSAEHTDPSYLRIYLAQLRRKLEAVPTEPRHLRTVPGIGYRFEP